VCWLSNEKKILSGSNMPTNSSAFAAMETTNPKYEAIYAAP